MQGRVQNSIWLVIAIFVLAMGCTAAGRTIYVDDDGPADFNNIQAAINDANDGDTVIVADGTYTGTGNRDINFSGKAITVKSENGPVNCIIDCNGTDTDFHRGFYFHSGEGGDSVLEGITITNGYADGNTGGGIYCSRSSPTISNCIIRGNVAPVIRVPDGIWGGTLVFNNGGGIGCYKSSPTITECYIVANRATGAGGAISLWGCSNPEIRNCVITGNIAPHEDYGRGGAIHSHSSSPIISNCTITGNLAGASGGGIYCVYGGIPAVTNSISWANLPLGIYVSTGAPATPVVTYSNIQGGWPGKGNTDVDPCFADVGYWDPNGTPQDANDDFWVDGDYHLKSQAGRWEPSNQSWVVDNVTSPCIDAGDMASPIGLESFPNGGIINMGAYGGTEEASKSYFGEPVCETIVAGDINGDCKVNYKDFALMALHWLEER